MSALSGLQHASAQLDGQARGGGVSVTGLGWHLTLVQLQRPGLAAGVVSRLFLQPERASSGKRPRERVSANADT